MLIMDVNHGFFLKYAQNPSQKRTSREPQVDEYARADYLRDDDDDP
jgi:hypothetical protein